MHGFFTLIAFVLALSAGGWFWLFFLIMLGAWGNKLEKKKKEKEAVSTQSNEVVVVKPKDDARRQTEQLGNANDWVIQLTEICSRFTASDYYVSELIPEQKLRNALQNYPIQNGGRAMALIDTTVFGSAENGMLISEKGLSWKNWVVPTKTSSMYWKEFSELALSIDGTKIKIGNDAVFETTGSQFGTNDTFALLSNISELIERQHEASAKSPQSKTREHKGTDAPVDISIASFDTLLGLPGIGAAEAKLILDRRASGAHFSSLDELVDFLNLKPHKAEQLRSQVVFSKPDSPSPAATPSPSSPQTNSPKWPYAAASPTPAPSQSAGGGRVID